MSKKKKINDKKNILFNISMDDFDPAGFKATAELTKEVVDTSLKGIKVFLNLAARPALTEFGLGLRDIFSSWRLGNVIETMKKVENKITFDIEDDKYKINSRVAYEIVENASLTEDTDLQEMWAGLFACSYDEKHDDENILFIEMLKKLTSSQVKLITYLCQKCEKTINLRDLPEVINEGLINTSPISLNIQEMMDIMETKNKLKAETEITILENSGLIEQRGSANLNTMVYKLRSGSKIAFAARPICVSLFIKCQGSREHSFDYFKQQIIDDIYNTIKDYIKVERNSVLRYIYEAGLIGKEYEDQIRFTEKNINIINTEWLNIEKEELNSRLRNYLIYHNIKMLSELISVQIGKEPKGVFSYKLGLH